MILPPRTSARERLLDCAQRSVLEKAFAATSIEELIAAAGISKSGFFYHFRDKNELAKALLHRYLEEDAAIVDDIFRRADELNEDPLHGFLIALKMLAEVMADLPGGHPGCLAAAYCYQEQQFSRDVVELNRQSMLAWRARYRARLDRIAERYPPRLPLDLDDLADMLATVIDGGITLAKITKDPSVLARQVMLYRATVRLLFQPA
ncbi:TetR/AcrR family transcriptional regulator [Roseomonas sp. CCTCC AB2023176]|uniref:TetR/AcrR family transcriptional regulator n=1 Tax=Roseomonas sp. CCTCC AB2023176 TaxID=3342640 RepID=UPI0035E0D8E2